jgi:hypothetical protein
MSKKIQISIPKPCHENWENMDVAEKGRFCGSCEKQVIDFSSMSDRDIAQFFKKPSTGSVCGRFNDGQLNRDIDIPRKRIPWLRYFFQVTIPALLFSRASAQGGKPPKVDRVQDNDSLRVKAGHELKTLGMVLNPQIIPAEKESATPVKPVDYKTTIKGKVVNEKGEPVAFARIRIDEGVAMTTDKQGAFCIAVDKLQKDSVLYVSSTGYRIEKVPVGKDDAVESEFFIHMRTDNQPQVKPVAQQPPTVDLQKGLKGKVGGLQVTRGRTWESRLFWRRGISRL